MIDLTPADLTRLTELLHEHGALDGLAQAAAAGAKGGARARRQPVPFRDAGQVLDAVAGKVLTRDEARRLLGIPTRRRTTRSKGEPA
ncbi:MAG TPA: hypothetical protein VMU20_21630 [Candidatus Dormibacteraeota bacterium]|nr:hypothetical protein [Candidatus Dormibacteraeota bacterium]